MQLSASQVEQIRTFFRDKPVHKVYLFGSYARGEADENSDIDLLIDWDYSKHIGWNYVGWWEEIKELLNKNVDFVSAKYVSPLIEQEIDSDKVLIYEA
ncbi:nucleotidyltransferase family protein [Flavobacterium aurantiibacter]|uniref:Nucleotidyltransferase n=1 Tax=Flavobacterium aurantiibacter TaxID=2023067 RepID=A0A255ZMX6_9FLAO|nr:nucleotidyltransferase domain-containing protein [Flavobacterium aurantiibacter]OYQ42264.1 nucleotidyltransferase [Flavobacterium aurantiibacter]